LLRQALGDGLGGAFLGGGAFFGGEGHDVL
jgi:hypothetical protein